jgi:hypothetical protein
VLREKLHDWYCSLSVVRVTHDKGSVGRGRGRKRAAHRSLVGKPKERNRLAGVDGDGRIILKRILMKQKARMSTGLI